MRKIKKRILLLPGCLTTPRHLPFVNEEEHDNTSVGRCKELDKLLKSQVPGRACRTKEYLEDAQLRMRWHK
jgi:hypothetical protein